MAIFDTSTLNNNWQIWQLLRHGPITLFHKTQVLEDTIRYLEQQKYIVHEFDCRQYDEQTILNEITSRLGVIQDYDRSPNLDGFHDYLGDVAVPNESGLVIVFRHYDTFHDKFTYYAQSILDIIAHVHHQKLLFGLHLIALVQMDNPQIQFEPVGAFVPAWNDKEWLMRDRASEQ